MRGRDAWSERPVSDHSDHIDWLELNNVSLQALCSPDQSLGQNPRLRRRPVSNCFLYRLIGRQVKRWSLLVCQSICSTACLMCWTVFNWCLTVWCLQGAFRGKAGRHQEGVPETLGGEWPNWDICTTLKLHYTRSDRKRVFCVPRSQTRPESLLLPQTQGRNSTNWSRSVNKSCREENLLGKYNADTFLCQCDLFIIKQESAHLMLFTNKIFLLILEIVSRKKSCLGQCKLLE